MYILFDIGGTKMRIALSRDGISFGTPVITQTPKNFDEGMAIFENTVSGLLKGTTENIKTVAGGLPGPVDKENGILIGAPHLPEWAGKPLVARISEICKATTYIENDAALAGLGEAVAGAGKGSDIVAYLTVSTGVGGARIVNGSVDESAYGFEPGHQIIDPDNSLCPECDGNDLESYVSGSAVMKRFGRHPKDIAMPHLWNDELPKFLAYGINNLIMHWSPDCIVLGGSMIVGDPAISISRTEEYLKDIARIFPELPVIKKAMLGDVGGLYGALEYARQKAYNSKYYR